jgi:small subunit ribosomal protein S17
MNTTVRAHRKTRLGRVVSDKGDKTVVVAIERLVQHPLYKRVVRRTNKLYVHDEQNEAHVGDTVEVMETRPLSKTKHWRLVRIVERAR